MLSQYGLYLDEIDDIQAAQLVTSYIRRLRFENRVLTASLLGGVAEVLGATNTRVPGNIMLAMLENKI